ncbi:FAD-dependent 2-octaprenylphenol hydroxylase [Edwardsiella hoshinae]|uniref:2-octaprenyl-3-methyl-6-methoxy-1,4-benzoquinol hydroxylase n=1 Tax=Edwardsiella hoshinae TaxID=93378 RepID=A0A376D7A3_9GAMM|nr:FAD-dependent 2-octaprenylphenol hydroxylase [Edwardsiella hoshinae]AOV95928.1 FAD-dependent 2-octaprenylphenol hydroxylase [Edwardsiella hoshinae]QPR28247.1 FAD-dependent 2-octaprenylphenol hydroxylase [Edwardsiella hoshinae]STC84239.1 2-octaprenyl-3-methyl-6-methoxy-1,4-benzoquinol hydroxylase [Edwardsiella hoshinae]
MQSFDLIVVGGGMVGLALANALSGSGLRIAVVEQRPPPPAAEGLRVSALNIASERLLQQLGVWPTILAQRASACRGMEVWEADSFGRIAFDADAYGHSHLGHIIENQVVQQALWQRAEQDKAITMLTPASVAQVAWGENEAFLTLTDGMMLSARLVVAADGAHSQLRQLADVPLTFWDYQQHALVATIHCAQPHGGIARQIFRSQGILAFLPLSDAHLCSIVWSLPPSEAQRLQTADDEAFERELTIAFDHRLGLCHCRSERQLFPLRGRYARSFAGHRLALMGDAAHTIHPLAGQGVNLGLMDAAELAGELRRLQAQGKDIGHHLYLRRYERRRKQSAALMLAAMQGFHDLFAGANPAKKLLRDLGLTLADRLPGIKPQLVRHAMGLADLPAILQTGASEIR